MDDKTLLELAARAAGHEVCDWDIVGNPIYRGDFEQANRATWHPLYDDGDALRLAVKLKMSINLWDFDRVSVQFGDIENCEERLGKDESAATRRAIVRAAAEVGKGMLTQDEFIRMFPGRFDYVTAAASLAEQGEK